MSEEKKVIKYVSEEAKEAGIIDISKMERIPGMDILSAERVEVIRYLPNTETEIKTYFTRRYLRVQGKK